MRLSRPAPFLLSALLAAPFLMPPASAITCANCGEGEGGPIPRPPSCLAEGTTVTVGNGAVLPVERVRPGQTLLVPGRPSLELAFSSPKPPPLKAEVVTAVYSALNTRPMYRVTDSAGHALTATDHHPIFTVNRGHVQMARLRVGDVLLTTGGRATVTRLSRVNASRQVFNFVVSLGNNPGNQGRGASHTFFANGILVGDLSVQETLTAHAR